MHNLKKMAPIYLPLNQHKLFQVLSDDENIMIEYKHCEITFIQMIFSKISK